MYEGSANTNYLQTGIHDITDPNILILLDELEKVTRVKRKIFPKNSMLIHYLQQCLLPNGAGTKEVPIDKIKIESSDDFTNSFLLRKQIKKLHETQIYQLCDEIAKLRGKSVEQVQGHHLHLFLSNYLKEPPKKKKRRSVNYLWQ